MRYNGDRFFTGDEFLKRKIEWAGDVDAPFAFLRYPSWGGNSREKRPRDRNAHPTQRFSAMYGFHG
jgi:hypothetical protein